MAQVISGIEAVTVGMTATTRRKFSLADLSVFGDLAPDHAPVHFKTEFAKLLGFSDVLVFGWLAAAPFSGLLGMELPGPHSILHWVRINMAGPVYVGDEIIYRTEVKQRSASTKSVVLDLVATKAETNETVIHGQAQCGFRS